MPTTRLDVERRAHELRQQIAALQQELVEVEQAAAVLRRIEGLAPDPATVDRATPDPAPAAARGDLSRHTTAEAAEAVMRTRPDVEWHYGDVAQAALFRGYAGRPGSSDKAVRDSFRRAMLKSPDTFVAVARGLFRLKRR